MEDGPTSSKSSTNRDTRGGGDRAVEVAGQEAGEGTAASPRSSVPGREVGGVPMDSASATARSGASTVVDMGTTSTPTRTGKDVAIGDDTAVALAFVGLGATSKRGCGIFSISVD
jgi:hypothetical protein